MQLPVTPDRLADNSSGSSDKEFTIRESLPGPWEVVSVYVTLTTSVSIGSRDVTVDVRDASGNVAARVKQGATQGNLSTVRYLFAVGLQNNTAISGYEQVAFPPFSLAPGWSIRVYDAAAVDASGDTMQVEILGRSA